MTHVSADTGCSFAVCVIQVHVSVSPSHGSSQSNCRARSCHITSRILANKRVEKAVYETYVLPEKD